MGSVKRCKRNLRGNRERTQSAQGQVAEYFLANYRQDSYYGKILNTVENAQAIL